MNNPTSDSENSTTKLSSTAKIGVLLILLSGVFFFTMLSVPWFPLTSAQKVGTGFGLFIAVQVSWWTGAAMAGPATFKAFKRRFAKSEDRSE